MEAIAGSYNFPLVFLSIFIAVFSSYTTLGIVNRVISSEGVIRNIWLCCGACSLGLGIWSMHFVAMLAFHLSIPVTYNIPLVVLSIILAILACYMAIYIVGKDLTRTVHIIIGSFFIGIGIVSMHYTGMAAMEMQASIEYDPLLLSLSIIIALLTSVVALFLFKIHSQSVGFNLSKLASSFVMGIAISGMHYSGMAAAKFEHYSQHDIFTSGMSLDSRILAYLVGIGTLALLIFMLVSIYMDKIIGQKSNQLEISENRYRSLIESANDGIIISNQDSVIISWNNGAYHIFGYQEDQILGKKLDTIIPGQTFHIFNEVGKSVELQGHRKNGDEFPLELSSATWNSGDEFFLSLIIRDITERKQIEEQINHMIYRDPLTNLPNRRLLSEQLALSVEQAHLNKQTLSVIFIDLDRFKHINDNLGHGIGDQLLIETARRMERHTGKLDILARQSGDEFICVFMNVDHQQAARKAQSILEELNKPFLIAEHELFISASIGISMYPSDGTVGEDLIKFADTAMYRVKENGRNQYQFYTADMNEWISKKMKLEYGLRRAIERHEFEIYYQPQMDVHTGEMKGVEALLRWKHPEWGMVFPGEFIPLAEETGLIIPIGKWVLQTACRQAKDWQKAGYAPLRMAINISARQFMQKDFIEMVRNILMETDFDPQYLELELTESIVQNPEYALPILNELKSMGIMLSLDDFGTGYSSLSYIKQFPLDTLKIDQSFIRSVEVESKDAAIVQTIIQLAASLNLKVIAEGVETGGQLDCLRRKNCTEFQGYLFSRPVPSHDIEALFNRKVTLG